MSSEHVPGILRHVQSQETTLFLDFGSYFAPIRLYLVLIWPHSALFGLIGPRQLNKSVTQKVPTEDTEKGVLWIDGMAQGAETRKIVDQANPETPRCSIMQHHTFENGDGRNVLFSLLA